MINWEKYEYCETCDAVKGQQCKDMRYSLKHGSHAFHIDKPHKGRKRIGNNNNNE